MKKTNYMFTLTAAIILLYPIAGAGPGPTVFADGDSERIDQAERSLPQGMPASPEYFEFIQPDGTRFEARLYGDEFYHFMETRDGWTIGENRKTGYFEYLVTNKRGAFISSGVRAGIDNPRQYGIPRKVRESRSVIREKMQLQESATSPADVQGPQKVASSGTVKKLIILANFSDTSTTYSQSNFDGLFNTPGFNSFGAKGSVWDYYNEVSYGALNLETTVSVWVTLPRTAAFYGTDEFTYQLIDGQYIAPAQLMVQEAIEALDATGFDFSPFDTDSDGWIDAFAVIHQGRGEEAGGGSSTIWSHKWGIPTMTVDGVSISLYYTAPEKYYSSISTIGVYCHEFGHSLGLPDLYDTDYSSAGVGDWGVMGGGSWNDSGRRPPHFLVWCKSKLGWVTPTLISSSQSGLSINKLSTTAQAYKITSGMATSEYLMIENRQKAEFDDYLDGAGLIITHIDETRSGNSNENRYKVGVLQADGLKHLEDYTNDGDAGDPFPGSSNNRELGPDTNPDTDSYVNGDTNTYIYNISNSANQMTFSVSLNGPPSGDLTVTIEPSEAITAGAQWRRSGTSTWMDSGATEEDIPIGEVTVEFKDTATWAPPADQSVEIIENDTATTTGTYTQKTGSLRVYIEPAGAVTNGAQWRRVGTSTWLNSGALETGLPIGDVEIEYKTGITNYTAPANDSATISWEVITEVTGNYIPDVGSLTVTISPAGAVSAGAQWRRSGTSPWFDSGATETDILVGDYSVEFKDVSGWNTPANQDVTIVKDTETTTSGTYVQQLGNLTVTIEPAGAVTAGAKWRRTGTATWLNSGTTESDLPVGEVTVEFRDVPAYLTSADQAATISDSTTTEVTGTYTASPLSLTVSDEDALPGDTISVFVFLNEGTGVRAFGFDLNFDTNYLEYQPSVAKGNLVPAGFVFSSNLIGGDAVRVGGYSGTEEALDSGAGSLAIVDFLVKESAPVDTSTLLQLGNLTDDIASSSTNDGTVSVVSCVPGYDMNGDGDVTPGDALIIFKHYLGLEILADSCSLSKADANEDGDITPGDALIVFKEYLGLN